MFYLAAGAEVVVNADAAPSTCRTMPAAVGLTIWTHTLSGYDLTTRSLAQLQVQDLLSYAPRK